MVILSSIQIEIKPRSREIHCGSFDTSLRHFWLNWYTKSQNNSFFSIFLKFLYKFLYNSKCSEDRKRNQLCSDYVVGDGESQNDEHHKNSVTNMTKLSPTVDDKPHYSLTLWNSSRGVIVLVFFYILGLVRYSSEIFILGKTLIQKYQNKYLILNNLNPIVERNNRYHPASKRVLRIYRNHCCINYESWLMSHWRTFFNESLFFKKSSIIRVLS